MNLSNIFIYRSTILLIFVSLFKVFQLEAQETFPPPETPLEIYAAPINMGTIVIDGVLDEKDWQMAEVVTGFTQRDPFQGEPASFDTEVRILYNEKYLYVSAVCLESLVSKNRLRVRNLRRDFQAYGNDRFSIALDGLLDKRNAVGFEVTPYGSQRELQVIDGDEGGGNDDWDALWFVRTQITDTAWVAEMAIPWKTLRYRADSREMLVSFNRNIRRDNEVTTWPSYPRVFSHFRMAYAAILRGIEPPPPAANVQINPYLVASRGREKRGLGEQENLSNFEAGGEFKWAITPNSVLDGTINTDFAQADVDQQVQNLTRFSVLFPERRQFFLENANIFRTSSFSNIQPFFSRRIGLDDNGRPIPLDGGLRFTNQTSKQTVGALAIRQRPDDLSPGAIFGVGRYVRNFAGQNRLGGMVTYRRDEALNENGVNLDARSNTTATINSFFRPRQSLSFESMISASSDSEAGQGIAAHAFVFQQKNWGFLGLAGQYVAPNYLPGVGFLAIRDYTLLNPIFDLDLRPKWLPAFVRSYGPDGSLDVLWRASDGAFQQAIARLALVDMQWQTGGDFEVRLRQEWQQLDETFSPLGIDIEPGFYSFTRADFGISSDFSKRFAASTRYEIGGFYDGELQSWRGQIQFAPIPQISLSAFYRYNRFENLGEERIDTETDLVSTSARLALNPRFQLIGSYQYNSANEADIWNVRLVWEYRPLSFLFLVYNSNISGDPLTPNRFESEEVVGKVTYIRQF